MCVYICACVVTHFFHSRGSHLQRVRGQWLVQGNDWGFKKFIRRGQCDDNLTLYCKVSSSHYSWPDVCSLLLCYSLCLYTHITPIHTQSLSHMHAYTYTLNTHTCTHTTHTLRLETSCARAPVNRRLTDHENQTTASTGSISANNHFKPVVQILSNRLIFCRGVASGITRVLHLAMMLGTRKQ